MLARRNTNPLGIGNFGFPSLFGGQSLFSQLFDNAQPVVSSETSRRYAIPIDVTSDNDNVTVTASLPGVSADNVDVSVENEILTISTKADSDSTNEDSNGNYLVRERVRGLYSRSIRLPKDADVDTASVSLKEGVLTVQFKNGHPRQVKSLPISTK